MSQSGQQHPKADNGGQRPTDRKDVKENGPTPAGSTKAAIDSAKNAGEGSKKDAKK